jgi:branched-chain amino acid transport system ATP-binding protein
VRVGRVKRQLDELTGGGPVYPLLILFGLNAVDELDRTAFAVLLPEIRDHFRLGIQGVLTIVALAFVAALLLQVPIAQWADRSNRVRIATGGAALWALFSFATGLATGVVILAIVRSGSAIGKAVVDPTHNSLIADFYDVQVRPRVYSFHRAANAVGAFVGPLAAGLLAAAFDWRAPFLVFAVPTLVLVVLALRIQEPLRGTFERRAMGASEDAVLTEEEPASFAEAWRTVWKIETLRRIWWSLPFLAASIIGAASLASLLYEQAFGLDERARGIVAACVEPAQLVGLVIGARVGTKLLLTDPGRVLKFLSHVAFGVSAVAVVFALSPWLGVAIAANALMTAALAALVPSILAALSLAIPPRARSVGFSVASLWIIPGLFVLPLIGWIADEWSIRAGLLVMVPIFLVGGLVIATAGPLVAGDIRQVWATAAARSEVAYERRHGRVPLLLVRGVDVAYNGVQVLFGVDLDVAEGEIVALLGTNGAGKSTLLKAITGTVEADRGAVILDGRDCTHAPAHENAARGVVLMPGGVGVFPSLTVGENLRVAAWLDHHADVDRVLRVFPVLGERLDVDAADLSGGQQQMLGLAMALLSKPRLLLIDELSLGLAPVVVEQLLPVVREVRDNGTTVVLVEQSVSTALAVADRVYVMEKGEVRLQGTAAELLHQPDALRSVFLRGAAEGGNRADPSGVSVTSGPPDGPNSPKAAEAGEAAETGALQLRGVTRRFGGIAAVDDVDLDVAPGEIVGILGPNGAGKTTLFDIVSGFLPPDEGEVRLAGVDVTRLDAAERARRGLGRSFQDARLFPSMTVAETIAVALERFTTVRDPLRPALRLPSSFDAEQRVTARVEELVDLLGLGAYRNKFLRELSTGTRRIVDLACLVAHRPTVVLLDEPSSGIAQRESEALAPLLRRLRDEMGASLVVIEHDVPLVASVADRLVAMDTGRVIASGVPDAVLVDPAVVESYLGSTLIH